MVNRRGRDFLQGHPSHESSTREGEMGTDQLARDKANEAMAKIMAHEMLCTERWDQQRGALEGVSKSIDLLHASIDSHIGRLPASIIAALMGICGWLAAHAFPVH